MTRARATAWITLAACLISLRLTAQPGAAAAPASGGQAAPQPELPPQTLLQPGLYLFQTRTRSGNCNDAPRTGYITSAVATLDGVPGARALTMQLINSKYWPSWSLSVTAEGVILGEAFMAGAKDDSKGSSHFELHAKKERFQGVGARTYPGLIDGKPARCTLEYDALLKPL
jgi:hypothetical protein